ncbi:hypothetical protein U1Q18_052264 [Sarracenia purpurea var. burkii]
MTIACPPTASFASRWLWCRWRWTLPLRAACVRDRPSFARVRARRRRLQRVCVERVKGARLAAVDALRHGVAEAAHRLFNGHLLAGKGIVDVQCERHLNGCCCTRSATEMARAAAACSSCACWLAMYWRQVAQLESGGASSMVAAGRLMRRPAMRCMSSASCTRTSCHRSRGRHQNELSTWPCCVVENSCTCSWCMRSWSSAVCTTAPATCLLGNT